VDVPEGPGLGVEIDWEFIMKNKVGGIEFAWLVNMMSQHLWMGFAGSNQENPGKCVRGGHVI
jgi:hypothetical protein